MERQKNKPILAAAAFFAILFLTVALFRLPEGRYAAASVESDAEQESESETDSADALPIEEDEEFVEEILTEESSECMTEAEEEESESESAAEAVTERQTEETEKQSERQTEKQTEETEKQTEVTEKQTEETERQTERQTEQQTEKETQGKEAEKPKTEETKSEPAAAKRGVDYELRGDDSAWFRDENDLLWLREGSNLYVEATDQSVYNTGAVLEDVRSDGVAAFSLKDTDEAGTVLQESAQIQEPYYVDAEAPVTTIRTDGSRRGEIVYAAQSCAVELEVEPDGKSGLFEVSYKIVPYDTLGDPAQLAARIPWTACGRSEAFEIEAEGLFQVYVRCVDRVGNVSFVTSDLICVDKTEPKIKIKGVKDQSANAGELGITVSCSDRYYKQGSLEVEINGVNNKKVPAVSESVTDSEGARIAFYDFPAQPGYDDIYELCATAEDLSGNKAESKIRFSVNRFGSVYDLSDETRQMLRARYINKAQPVTFYETNIDYVGESALYCRLDGSLRTLERGKDYTVSMEGGKNSWKTYKYFIPETYFEEEGVYELLLTSTDAAKNESDTGMQKKRVTFVLDYSEPGCSVSGIGAEEIYPDKAVRAVVKAHDGGGLKQMKIYRNSALILERDADAEAELSETVTLEAEEDWQTLQIWLVDMAGNAHWSEEIPVFVGAAGKVPPYQKKRLSAEELAEGKVQKTGENGEESGLLKAASAGAGAAGDGQASLSGKTFRRAAEDRLGTLFLLIGFLAFAGTAVFICICRKSRPGSE